MPVIPFVPLIAAGIGGGLGLLGAKKSADASKQQSATISPLIQQQAETSRFAREQAGIDLPKARATLGSSLDFWNTITRGDRNQAMSLIGPTADQQAGQTAALNRNLLENAPRGGRRTLMLGEQPLNAETSLNQNLLSLRAGAVDKSTSIGQILAQLGLGETGASTAAGNSAISGAIDAGKLADTSAATTAEGLRTFGQSLGQMLLLLKNPAKADSHPTPPAIPNSVLAGPAYTSAPFGP